MPSYYKNFRCIADKCSDNCCIGWEIAIDKNTLNFYKTLNGNLAEKLQNSICKTDPAHFILGKDKRCPFLNEVNLCDIYINLGEEHLCNICKDHPRYFQWYHNIKEGGIGMCCQVAAKIILTYNKPFSYYDTKIDFESSDEYDQNLYNYLFKIREYIILHLNNKAIPLKNRLNDILNYSNQLQENYDNFNFKINSITQYPIDAANNGFIGILNFFEKLESLDEHKTFKELISNLDNILSITEKMFNEFPYIYDYLENAAVYFVYRHFLSSVYEEEFYSKIAFSVLSAVIISMLFAFEYIRSNTLSLEGCIKSAVFYSKEIEYSEENLNLIFDQFYENKAFSLKNLEKSLNIF